MLFLLTAPSVMAQWASMGGPEGGDIVAMANAGSYLVCGAVDGDIFTSSDNGATWIRKGKVPGSFLTKLAAGSGILFATGSGGMHRSTDNGLTWTLQLNPFAYRVFAHGTQVLATTSNGLFYSTNSGGTWSNITGNLPRVAIAAIIHGSSMFVGMQDSAVYRSTNNGASWFRAWTDATRRNINILASDGAKLYAAYSNEARLFSSTDNGTSWISSDIIVTSTMNEYVNDLVVTPSGIFMPTIYQTSFSFPWIAGMYVSTNAGVSWNLRTQGLMPKWVNAAAAEGSDILAATKGGGVFRSTDAGTTWLRSSGGLVKSRITFLSFSTASDWVAGVDGGGFFASSDSGRTWAPRNSGFENLFSYPVLTNFLTKANTWFVGTQEDGLFKSTNNGTQWAYTGGGPFATTGLAIKGTELIATEAVTDGVFRSTDDGATWGQIMTGFITAGPTCVTVGGAGTIFVGSFDGRVLRTTNNGTNWFGSVIGGTPFFLRFVGNKMFAGTDDGPYQSTNFGVTWTPANSGLGGRTVNFIAIQDTNTMFASTADSGLYVSSNAGLSWRAANNGLSALQLTGVRSTGLYIYCGTAGNGVWRRRTTEVLTNVLEDHPTGKPVEFELSQNYPNPFNPSTRIEYALPHPGHVRLMVYNVLGQLVATLVDEERPAGRFAVEWNGTGLNGNVLGSGVYFYTMVAQGIAGGQMFTRTGKMMLVK